MHLFWVKGYGATSMGDLLEGMGIGRAIFYATFGDKRALFLAAFDRFEGGRTSWVDEALAAPGLDGVEKVFRRTRSGGLLPPSPGGDACSRTPRSSSPPRPGGGREDLALRPAYGGGLRWGVGPRSGAGETPVAAGGDPKALARFLVRGLHVRAADDRRRSGADPAG